MLRSGEAALIVAFWGFGENVAVELQVYAKVSDTVWSITHDDGSKKVVDVSCIVDTATFAKLDDATVRVVLPVRNKLGLL